MCHFAECLPLASIRMSGARAFSQRRPQEKVKISGEFHQEDRRARIAWTSSAASDWPRRGRRLQPGGFNRIYRRLWVRGELGPLNLPERAWAASTHAQGHRPKPERAYHPDALVEVADAGMKAQNRYACRLSIGSKVSRENGLRGSGRPDAPSNSVAAFVAPGRWRRHGVQ